MNGAGERRLLDTDPLRGTGEMPLFGNRNEIPKVAEFHARSVRKRWVHSQGIQAQSGEEMNFKSCDGSCQKSR
jgi:hypothetical protein